MKVIEKPIDTIKPYKNNNKIHDDEQILRIANSIKEFWFTQPVVIDKNNIIIIGHWRVEAAKKLWLEKVPCVLMENLSEEQVKKLRILDNKLNESEWNIENLKIDLGDLPDFNIWDIKLSTEDLFGDLLFDEDEEEPEIEEDEAPEVQGKAKMVRGGDLFILWNHRLKCWDATKIEDVEDLMDWKLADLVFTDPPYWIKVVWKNWKVGAGNLAKNKIYSEVIGDDTTETAEKNYNLMKQIAKKMIIWWWNYFTQFLDYSDWYIVWDKRGDMNSNNFADWEIARCSFHTPVRIYKQIWNWMIREWEREKRIHPTQKPVKMLWKILKDFTKKDETIIDCFWWSGSTLIACEQLKRKCFMMELDPVYVEAIIKRFHNINPDAKIKCLNRDLNIKELYDE